MLALALASVILLGLVAGARADERTVGTAGPSVAASGSGMAGESPPPPPQAAGTEVSEAVKEAIGQASAKQPQEATRGEQGSLAAASNATAQLIWQAEVSQCTSGCYGTKQYQSAEQQNTTRQQITTAAAPGGDQRAPVTDEHSQATSSVTQIQFGCLSYCFGTTATAKQPPSAPYGQVLAELLRQVTAALSDLSPPPAAEQSAVEQVSFQSQTAATDALTQAQSAVQASATTQSYTPSLVAGLASGLAGSQAPGGEVVSQTEQGIWQLQIGCLFLCRETVQYQQAEQANATQQTVVSPAGSAADPSAYPSATVTQAIWQVQIGCLFWCFDTTQQQIGTTRNELTVVRGEGAAAPPPPQAPPVSPDAGPEATPQPGATNPQSLPGTPAPAPASGHGAISAPAPPLATPPTFTGRVRERASILSSASLKTAGGHRRDAPPARFATAPWSAGAGVRPADAPMAFAQRRALLHRHGGVSARIAPGRPPLLVGAVAAGGAFVSSGRTAPGDVGVLLAVFALCGVGCLRIAAIRTRRGSRAGHQSRLTSE